MYKMKPKVLSYGETCINKNAFHKKTTGINIDEVEINKITLLDKTSYGNKGSFKYHIRYRHKNEALPSPLNIKLPPLTGYTKNFDNDNKYVNLLVNDKKLLKRYNEIRDNISSYISTKIKIYNDTINTEFKYKKILKDNMHCKYIPIEPKIYIFIYNTTRFYSC